MRRKTARLLLILLILQLIPTSGCDDRATQIAREAADRQAQQNTVVTDLTKQVAGGSRELVAADSEARKEIIGVHHDLQAERSRLDIDWHALEQERKQIASERRTESLVGPLVEAIGGLTLVVLLFGFCWHILAISRGDSTDTELHEILIREVLETHQLDSSGHGDNLLEQSEDDNRSDS